MDQPGGGTGKLAALVVDDEEPIRTVLEMTVSLLGYDVHAAADGQQALRCLSGRAYDLIICDLLMPRMTGDELFRVCRRENPEAASRFVFVTCCPGRLPGTDFIATTGQPWLGKPWRLQELEAAIDQIARSEPVGPRRAALTPSRSRHGARWGVPRTWCSGGTRAV